MVTCIQGHSDIFVLVKRGVWNWTACITQQGIGQHSVSCADAYPLVKDLPAQHCGKTHTAACWTDIYFLSREYGGDTSMLRPKVQVLLRGWDCYDCWTRILLRHSALPVVACILQSGWVLCTACLWVSDSLAPCSLQLTPQEHSCLYLYLLFSFSLGSTFETKFALRSRGWCGSLSGSALTGKGTIIHILSKTQWNSWMFSRQLPCLITLIWV